MWDIALIAPLKVFGNIHSIEKSTHIVLFSSQEGQMNRIEWQLASEYAGSGSHLDCGFLLYKATLLSLHSFSIDGIFNQDLSLYTR